MTLLPNQTSWRFAALAAPVLFMGCATPPLDTSPIETVAVVTAKTSLNGRLVPTFNGTQSVFTLPDKRRIDNKVEFDSFVMRWANFDTSDIARVDRKIMWAIDHDDEEYEECPIYGCDSPTDWTTRVKKSQTDSDEGYQSYDEKSCQVSLKNHQFDVKKTGRNRTISGLDTQEYSVDWIIEMADEKGKIDRNQITFSFWNTVPNKNMKQAWKIHQDFYDNIYPELSKNPLAAALGKEGYQAIAGFTGDIKKTNPKAMNVVERKLAAMSGYPLSIKMEWYQKAEACQSEKPKKESNGFNLADGFSGVASGLESMATDYLDKKAKQLEDEWKKDPVVRYIYEVKGVGMKPVRMSTFELPNGYTLENRS